MLVARSMHEQWLSNAYVLGDAPGGTAVFVDSGAPLAPLLELVERERLKPTHLLRTHAHGDHVEHEDELCDRFGIPVVTGDLVTGGLNVRAIALPGHSDDGLAFVVNDEICFIKHALVNICFILHSRCCFCLMNIKLIFCWLSKTFLRYQIKFRFLTSIFCSS